MPKDISNQDSKHELQGTKKALEQSTPEQDSSKKEPKQVSSGQFQASQKAEGESLPKMTKPKKALKGKIKSRSRRKVKHRAKFFSLKGKAEKKNNRGRIPVGKKPDIKTATRFVNAAHKALPLDKIQGHAEDNSKDTAKRLIGEAKSLMGEEPQSAEAEESPEQYAIEQMEGKANKAANIALSETKRAVEKSLTQEKTPMSDGGPSLQSKEEEAPEAYKEGLQKEVDKGADSNIIKEQGLKTHREVSPETNSLYPTEVQPTPFSQPSAIPVPHSSGGTVHFLEEHFIPASSHDIAAASPSLHTLDQEERIAQDGIAAPSSPDNLQSGLLQRSQDVQTVESASPSVLYPEPERSAYQYYPEIQTFIEAQLKSNFRAKRHKELSVFWGIGELKTNLQRIISEHPDKCTCVKNFANRVPPLNLDIFALITDGTQFEILILEVKLMNSAGLKEWSQLVGYCLVSGAKYGLLVNIDNGASPRLAHILSTETHISDIQTIVDGESHEHCLGFMQWDSLTQNFEYSNLGLIKSLSELSNHLADEFSS